LKGKEAVLLPAQEEAILALVSLGYTKYDARRVLEMVALESKESLPLEEMIKRALKYTR
jgi:Holliday junction resolvasome RuvABC DNA-binding subunit